MEAVNIVKLTELYLLLRIPLIRANLLMVSDKYWPFYTRLLSQIDRLLIFELQLQCFNK